MAFPLVLILLTAFAAARVTRVITTDKIGEPFREWVVRRVGAGSKIAYLVFCRWCTGLYIAAGAACAVWWGAGLRHVFPVSGWFAVPVLTLAISYSIGLLVRAEPE